MRHALTVTVVVDLWINTIARHKIHFFDETETDGILYGKFRGKPLTTGNGSFKAGNENFIKINQRAFFVAI